MEQLGWAGRSMQQRPLGGFHELHHLIDRAAAVAAVLAELDVRRNDPVLIMLPDGPGFADLPRYDN